MSSAFKGTNKRRQYEGTAIHGSGALDCEPIGCEAIKQPTLLENMVETSQRLGQIENKIDSAVGILFGNHAVCEECCEKESIANIEGEAHKARMSADRILEDLTNIIERLVD